MRILEKIKFMQTYPFLQCAEIWFSCDSAHLCCQVCDEPHPLLVKDMIQHCVVGNLDEAYKVMSYLWKLGHSPEDIISIVFRVCKTHEMPEYLKLEFIKVS